MKSARDAFFGRLCSMIESGEDIYVVSADIGAPSLDGLRRDCPERFINVGIAEQSLISISAGLALSGKKVVAYGLNPFPVTRAYDQVRCLMAEMRIPMTLCALNAGICAAAAGYTHMATEVFGMMRMLPCIQIATPSDETMAEMLADATASSTVPRYVMFDKAVQGRMYRKDALDFGKGYCVHQPMGGRGIGLVSSGCYAGMARKLADDFAADGIPVTAYDVFSLPVDQRSFAADVRECICLITIEENMLEAGLGSHVLEIASDHGLQIPVKRMGIRLKDGVPRKFMSREHLREAQGLSEESIAAAIRTAAGSGAI